MRGPVCILAGAGTGKTRAITHRIAYAVRTGAVPPDQLLAVTFTARAAGELRTRLRLLGRQRRAGAHVPRRRAAPAAVLRAAHPRRRPARGRRQPATASSATPPPACGCASTAPSCATSPPRSTGPSRCSPRPRPTSQRARAAGRETTTTPDTVAKLYAEYEQAKRRAGQIDFADLLLIMAGALEELPDVAEEVRSRYRHFVVDEYQDVSPLQQRLLDAWLGDRDDLCVVGDANQTIYSFAGATPEHLLGFRRRFPEAVVVRLHRDYRSTPQVVELANSLVRGGAAGLTLVGQRPDGPAPDVRRVRRRAGRGRRRRGPVPRARRRRHAGGRDRRAVPRQRAVRGLRAGAGPGRGRLRPARRRTILRPPRDPRGPAAAARRRPSRARTPTSRCPTPCAACCRACPGTPTTPRRAARPASAGNRWPRWSRWPTTCWRSAPEAHLPELVAELDQRASAQHAPTVQGVTLASLHSAKGLEWDAVFLVGLTDTTLPIQHATTPEQIAEERRLLYVGITRARERLALSWALARSPGQRRGRRPSRFLDGLRPSIPRDAEAEEGEDARRPRPRTPSCSAGCARGARPRPRRRACRPTSCSATPRSSRSPTPGPAAAAAWPRSPASGRPS